MSTGQLQLIQWPSHSKVIDRIADKECKMGFGKPLKKTKYNSIPIGIPTIEVVKAEDIRILQEFWSEFLSKK